VLAIPRQVPARLPGNFLLLAQKKVTKEKSPELNFNFAKHQSGKELTTGYRPACRGMTLPKLRRLRPSLGSVSGR
jgi:hypothetical protein